MARTDASCNKNRSFIGEGGGGGGASVHRLVQSGVFVEYVVLTSTLPFPVSTGTCGDKLNYI